MKLIKRVMTVTILSAFSLLITACAGDRLIPESNPNPTADVESGLDNAATASIPQQPEELDEMTNSLTKVTTGFSELWNEWSPDGRYLALDLLGPMHEAGQNQAYRTLYFLDALTGDLCSGLQEPVKFIEDDMVEDMMWPEEPDNFFEHSFVWVEDNRLLYTNNSGEILYLTPCSETVEYPLPNLTDKIVRIFTTNDDRSQIILESDGIYWLYLPETNEINQLDLPPQPENNSACFKWSPWEEKVLLTRLEERQNRYWIVIEHLDPQTRIRSNLTEFQAAGRSGGDSGWGYCVNWLGKESYWLWEADGSIWLINASTEPATRINLFSDLLEQPYHNTQFLNKGIYFGVVPGTGGEDFHIYVGIGLRGDGEFFLYHAESGIVDRMPNDLMTVLVFQSGEIGLTQLDEMQPPYSDTFRLIRVDSAEPKSIEVQGHQPRPRAYLQVDKIPGTQHLLFSSIHGISLLDIDSGETLRFWRLDEPELFESFRSTISPDGKTIVGFASPINSNWTSASKDIYWLRLEP